ncbi:hypothetical protein CALCODRAFT_480833 [Calocera cornea HHB12733]|uniref:Uncharacterized protein n=1 Tax=Calocera cornea HHB12733 TaxID=1353952 RepID=A0A165IAD0_9BASI|nr:hypothetical protein CALCODRAFT_480833 [Calocera cornea HHB12733]
MDKSDSPESGAAAAATTGTDKSTDKSTAAPPPMQRAPAGTFKANTSAARQTSSSCQTLAVMLGLLWLITLVLTFVLLILVMFFVLQRERGAR